MKFSLSILLFLFLISAVKAQDDYLKKGNELLSKGKLYEAEKVFREAMKSDSTNLVYQAQLSLSLIQQEKFFDAETIIENILLRDSLNQAALWYGGLNNSLNTVGDKHKAVMYLEKLLTLIPQSSPQYYSANYFIGKNYKELLGLEGLSYDEVSRMIEAYSTYIKLQPEAEDAGNISDYIEHIKKVRPPSNVKKWVNIPEGKNK